MNRFEDHTKTMAIILKETLDGSKTVLYVSHDEKDGMWQFLDGSDELDVNNARIVTLEEMLEIDESCSLLWNLPPGWVAERDKNEGLWTKRKKISPVTLLSYLGAFLKDLCNLYLNQRSSAIGREDLTSRSFIWKKLLLVMIGFEIIGSEYFMIRIY